MAIKRRAGGYRNIENFKTVTYFHCGGLQLYPRKNRLDRKITSDSLKALGHPGRPGGGPAI
jgi:hypothetical protein